MRRSSRATSPAISSRSKVRVDGDARRGLGRLVQPRRVGRADVDPRAQPAREIAHRERRLVGLGDAPRKCEALGELQAIGQHARDEVVLGLRRMARHLERQRLVHAAIDVR